MRITFVIPFASLSGGIRVVATYARELQARGHVVTVVSCAPGVRLSRRQRLLIALGLAKRPQPPARPTNPLLEVLGDRHIVAPGKIRAEDVPDADVIVASWWETAEWIDAMPPAKGRKFYLLQDYELFHDQPHDRVAATYRAPLRKIAVSSYIRDRITSSHEISGDITVVPNAVDLDHFQGPERSRNARPRVGFLYTTAERKNVALALEALRRAREHADFDVVAFGDPPDSPELPLPEWVTYSRKPDQDRIPEIYAACDVWLFPSREEGFGLPLLEAMASRTPVLATDAGAAPDLVDGQNGVILPHDPGAFAEAILRFVRMDPEEWTQWSDAAYRTASRNRWEDATDRLLAVLQEEPSV